MTNNENEMRAQFEAWFKESFWHECYEDIRHHLFAAWQASRQALVIELPETPNRGIGYGLFDAGKEACREAIESQGVKCK